ncbi:MAG: hypothetical protein P4L84_03435 [Isosphaeraceae bacterium]|nr:hypothetical protein [Isosphaeraceae bacterium]
MNQRVWLALLTVLGLAMTGPARADEELEQHLAALRRQVEDNLRPLPVRAQLVLEMAATLDRAAQNAPTADQRRSDWQRAVALLDEFTRLNPGQPAAPQFEAQAAIYLWAKGVDLAREAEMSLQGKPLREQAVKELDGAIIRLRKVNEEITAPNDALAQNVRFRLAQTLTDRAGLVEGSVDEKRRREREALAALEPPISEMTLQGYAHLLRAQVLASLDRFERALDEVDAAAKSEQPPSSQELVEVRTSVLIGLARFDEALKAIQKAAADTVLKSSLTAEVLLARRAKATGSSDRDAIDSELFRALQPLRGSERTQARRTLMKAAKQVETPDAQAGPEAWEALADGALALGELRRAGALESKAADLAGEKGPAKPAQAIRLKAGAILYQAEDFAAAESLLSQVFNDPDSGTSRAKAGLLRALARGRALALASPGATREAYQDALKDLIREFPDDPLTSEARWLLGQLSFATLQPDEARAQWMAIRHGSPRWLESRLAVARLQQEELDRLVLVNDRDQMRERERAARKFVNESHEQATTPAERAELELALARLDLTAEVGKPDAARAICERIATSAVTNELLGRARLLLLLAFAELNRFVEAERIAHEQAGQLPPTELIETVRWLDRTASNSESELRRRRFGLLMRVLLKPMLEHVDDLTPALRWETRLRQARALLFTGDDAGARRALSEVANLPARARDEDYRDLAEAYFGLEAYELAIDVQRLRARRGRTGSLAWFDARYGLALAYYRAGREHEARQLIDATTILHPELGGGELREKFIRLRQRLNPD